MDKQRFIIAAILTILLSSCSKDFQSSNWGDSMEDVKHAESTAQEWSHEESPDGSQVAMYYEGHIENLPAIILFAFSRDELVWGRYMFLEQHPNPDQFYTDYTIVNSALQEKLGSVDVDYLFKADDKKQSPEQWGESIYLGDLMLQCIWENKRSKVLHAMLAENGEVVHEVEFESIRSAN